MEKKDQVHPEDINDILYWTKRLGVDQRQIYDAILDTGSVRVIEIKKALKQKGQLHLLPLWLYKLIRIL